MPEKLLVSPIEMVVRFLILLALALPIPAGAGQDATLTLELQSRELVGGSGAHRVLIYIEIYPK